MILLNEQQTGTTSPAATAAGDAQRQFVTTVVDPPDLSGAEAAAAFKRVVEYRTKTASYGTTVSAGECLRHLGFRIGSNHLAAAEFVQAVIDQFRSTDNLIDRAVQALETWSPTKDLSQRWRDVVLPIAKRRIKNEFEIAYTDGGSVTPELVEGVVCEREPAVMGGSEKTMKTTVAAWMTACLVSGKPFLGHKVTKPCSVFVLTLETRPDAFFQKVAASLQTLGMTEDDAYQLANDSVMTTDSTCLIRKKADRQKLHDYLWAANVKVAILDPLYLLMPDGLTTDVSAAGRRLRRICQPFIEHYVTPILVHHATKNIKPGKPIDLGDLAGAGIAEYARSWMLLNRKAEYAGGGVHDLIAVAGTSRGAYDRQDVRVDERKDLIVTTGSPAANGRGGRGYFVRERR